MEITSGQPNVTVGAGTNSWGADMGIVFLAFLAMMGGWGGMNRGGPMMPNNVATSDTVNAATQFSSLQDQNQNIENHISSVHADNMRQLGGVYSELQRDISNTNAQIAQLAAQQAECCCKIQTELAAQTLRTTEQFAALNQKIDQSEIQRLRDQVQDLKADVRMQGVFRMPQGYTFNAGPGPFSASPLPPPYQTMM